ncbi:hypothetical protein SRHO_G00341380 [Serrasalmus rhombeus]
MDGLGEERSGLKQLMQDLSRQDLNPFSQHSLECGIFPFHLKWCNSRHPLTQTWRTWKAPENVPRARRFGSERLYSALGATVFQHPFIPAAEQRALRWSRSKGHNSDGGDLLTVAKQRRRWRGSL